MRTGADDFAFKRNIHEKFRHVTGRAADGRVAGTHHPDAVEQTHGAIHLQTEIGDVGGGGFFENLDQPALDVIGQLEQRLVLPAGGNAFEVLRRKFSLKPVFEGEVELGRFIGLAMAQDGFGFARIVVAVVVEENDFAADLRLQPPGRLDFGKQEPSREKSARLLAETNDRRWCS